VTRGSSPVIREGKAAAGSSLVLVK